MSHKDSNIFESSSTLDLIQQLWWQNFSQVHDGASCNPDVNNNVPCYCVNQFSLYMSGVQLFIFMAAIVTFLCYNCKSKDPD